MIIKKKKRRIYWTSFQPICFILHNSIRCFHRYHLLQLCSRCCTCSPCNNPTCSQCLHACAQKNNISCFENTYEIKSNIWSDEKIKWKNIRFTWVLRWHLNVEWDLKKRSLKFFEFFYDCKFYLICQFDLSAYVCMYADVKTVAQYNNYNKRIPRKNNYISISQIWHVLIHIHNHRMNLNSICELYELRVSYAFVKTFRLPSCCRCVLLALQSNPSIGKNSCLLKHSLLLNSLFIFVILSYFYWPTLTQLCNYKATTVQNDRRGNFVQ